MVSAIFIGNASAQQRQVTGKVTDVATGEPIAGANVSIEGTSIGVMTDADGKFSISISDEKAVLLVSFIRFLRIRLM